MFGYPNVIVEIDDWIILSNRHTYDTNFHLIFKPLNIDYLIDISDCYENMLDPYEMIELDEIDLLFSLVWKKRKYVF